MEAKQGKQVHPKKSKMVNEKNLNNILDAIKRGSPISRASVAFGISKSHFYNLLAQGISDIENDIFDSLEAKLVVNHNKIMMNDIISCRNDIRDNQKGHLGAQWILEHYHWRDFGGNTQVKELAEEIEALRKQLNGAKQHGKEAEEIHSSNEHEEGSAT